MTPKMAKSISKKGQKLPLLLQFPVNDHFVIGIYQGTISKFDMIIKYRQLINGKWKRSRTPKHIHWAVDILIKQNEEPEETDKLIHFLLDYWENVQPIKNDEEREHLLNIGNLKAEVNKEAKNYEALANSGEYSVKFLLLLAKLLMFQEKTNNPQAYMFKKLLAQIKDCPCIFEILSTATHHR